MKPRLNPLRSSLHELNGVKWTPQLNQPMADHKAVFNGVKLMIENKLKRYSARLFVQSNNSECVPTRTGLSSKSDIV